MKLEITRKTDLAIRTLRTLEARGTLKGPELAEAVATTPAYVAQVVQPLVQQGWITSQPGPSGGYTLAAPTQNISMLQAIEAVEGPTPDDVCVLRGGPCIPDERCALHDAWAEARTALLEKLSSIPITATAHKGVT